MIEHALAPAGIRNEGDIDFRHAGPRATLSADSRYHDNTPHPPHPVVVAAVAAVAAATRAPGAVGRESGRTPSSRSRQALLSTCEGVKAVKKRRGNPTRASRR